MNYPYTVVLQSKDGHRPIKFKTEAPDISTLISRLKKTELRNHSIKSLIRRPRNATQ